MFPDEGGGTRDEDGPRLSQLQIVDNQVHVSTPLPPNHLLSPPRGGAAKTLLPNLIQ